ncbi:TonB-dependent siderophore receptor [Xylophilus sp.]|uniref:TonB-dependent siderophore receptor n=1 Tax=Xylophilus sp. TaxID=2653893 RepID=UPI0013B9F1ED|nr:TonB-dependent receptor [Xylophilus sp.]KAF1044624.1 MAG: Fe(3+)-pyochelin receptor [Xylophilus sp.]
MPSPAVRRPHPRRHRLAHAALLACLLAAAQPPAQAQQPQPAAPSATRHAYDIPAGPLAPALRRAASQAGVVLSFTPAQTEGRTTAGLRGSHTAEEALSALLAGSGLALVRTEGGSYALQGGSGAHAGQSAAPQAAALCEVTVTAQAGRNAAATEGTGSYASGSVNVFKGMRSTREIPQPVTVVTRQFLDDRVLPDLHDVLQNTPGVTVDYTDSERVSYYSRGYAIDSLQVDGLSLSQSGSVFVQPDTAVLDHIEVLRGAAGMLRGSGNPSATVTMVRKRPTQDFQASAGLLAGSWDRWRAEADIGGPLNEAGTLRGRLVAVADKKHFFQKARQEERKVLYGVLEADLGPRTTLTASLQHSDLDATGAWGNLPSNLDGSPLGLPRDTYLDSAWNRWNRYNSQAFAELEHRLGDGWKLRLNTSYALLKMKNDGFKETYFSRVSGTTNPYLFNVSTSIYGGDASYQNATSAVLDGPFTLLGRRHQLVFGLDAQRIKTIATSGTGGLNPQTVDIRTWDPYTSYGESYAAVTARGAQTRTSQQGAFATARLSLADPLTAIVGARLSWWDYKAPASPSSNYSVDREVTPFAALTYDLSENLTAYGSYTGIFSPQNYYDVSGRLLDPVRGTDFETGVKGEFLGGRLNASLSLFRINNVGKGVQDTASGSPCLPHYTNGYCYINGGKTRSQGWEAEISGEVRPGWQLTAGYTDTRTRTIRDSSASAVGQPLRSADPRHQLRLFTSWRPGGALQGWTIGGGVQAQSDFYTTASGLTARQGGYAVYNAMLGYRINDRYSVQLNVNNLFDKVYFKKVDPTGTSNYYGDPRNVMVSLRARF